MNNITKAEYSLENLDKLYLSKINSNDLLGALSILFRKVDVEGENSKNLSQIASLYFKFHEYEKASNYWYKYLKVCNEKEKAKGYNGLGAVYYKLNNNSLAGYYFNEQLKCKSNVYYEYNDIGAEFFDELYENKSNYYIAYPYNVADFTKTVDYCAQLIREGEYEKTIDILSIIPNDSKFYDDALIQSGLCYFFLNQKEKAIKCLELSVKNNKENVVALCNIISVYIDTNKKEKAREFLDILNSLEFNDSDNIFKALMINCEIKNYENSVKYAEKYLKLNAYSCNALYLYGVSLYNLERYNEAEKVFLKWHRITRNIISKSYLNAVSKAIIKNSKGKKVEKLVYSFDLEKSYKKRLVKNIEEIISLDDKTSVNEEKLNEIVQYALHYRNYTLQTTVASILIKLNSKFSQNLMKKLLFSNSVYDVVKSGIIGYFASKCEKMILDVVCSNIYSKIELFDVELKGNNSQVFINAYAVLFSKLFPLEKTLKPFASTAEEMFLIADLYGFADKITDEKSLSAVIFEFSGVKKIESRRDFAKFFSANLSTVKKIKQLYFSNGVDIEHFKEFNQFQENYLKELVNFVSEEYSDEE